MDIRDVKTVWSLLPSGFKNCSFAFVNVYMCICILICNIVLC